MMTELYLVLTSLTMGQVYAPRPPQGPTEIAPAVRSAAVNRPSQAPAKSVIESDAVPSPKSSPTIFRWLEMETPAGAWGLFKDGGLIGLHRPNRGYQRHLGDDVYELATSEPPIDLPEHLRREREKLTASVPRSRQAALPFSEAGQREAAQAVADAEEQESRLLSMLPEGFQLYKAANYSQRLSILNERDHNQMHHRKQDDSFGVNPNRVDPYAVPGGLERVNGWQTRTAILFPPGGLMSLFTKRVRARAERLLPKRVWDFPEGTLVADVLLNANNEPFEIRMLEARKRTWTPKIYFSDMSKAPAGYRPPKMNECMNCHGDVGGSHAQRYGVGVRGSDGIFSFTPFRDGTFELDPKWPIKEGE